MKCLVTKLSNSVQDDTLLKMGEFKIHINRISNPSKANNSLTLVTAVGTALRIVGDGYFTNQNMVENLGKTYICSNETNYISFSNGDYDIIVSNKYDIKELQFEVAFYGTPNMLLKNAAIFLDDLKYSTNITVLNLVHTCSTGDLSSIKNLTSLKRFSAVGTFVVGNTSDITKLTNIEYIVLTPYISSKLSDLSALTKIDTVSLYNGTGDLSSVASLTNCKLMFFRKSNITGDLAKLPDSVTLINLEDNTGTFLWTSRTSGKIFNIIGSPKIANIDKMLQDLSALPASSESVKQITATGTRTTASDDAVATLQSKGYTVSITPA